MHGQNHIKDEEIFQPSVKNIRCITGDLLVLQLGLFP